MGATTTLPRDFSGGRSPGFRDPGRDADGGSPARDRSNNDRPGADDRPCTDVNTGNYCSAGTDERAPSDPDVARKRRPRTDMRQGPNVSIMVDRAAGVRDHVVAELTARLHDSSGENDRPAAKPAVLSYDRGGMNHAGGDPVRREGFRDGLTGPVVADADQYRLGRLRDDPGDGPTDRDIEDTLTPTAASVVGDPSHHQTRRLTGCHHNLPMASRPEDTDCPRSRGPEGGGGCRGHGDTVPRIR